MPPSRAKPTSTALLLIDFLNPLDFPGAGRLKKRAIEAARHTAALKKQAQAAKLPCIYVNDHFGDWGASVAEVIAAVEQSNPAAQELVSLLGPGKGDISILKPRHSGFYGTPLEFLLEELGARRLILTGLATDNCVFATAQDAYVRKFEIWIPSNCVAAPSDDEPAVVRHMARTLKAKTQGYRGRLWPSTLRRGN